MQGMNEKTGKYLSDVEYLKQSIKTIITTRIRSRVMRRNFGSNVFNRIDNPISRLKIINDLINNSQTCPDIFLPWLAWSVSVDVWDETWTVDIRRNVIKSSFEVHKKKGTLGALKDALAAFTYADISIEEWFQYSGQPYMFRIFVELIQTGLDIRLVNDMYDVVMQTKNIRSWLEKLTLFIKSKGINPYFSSALILDEVLCLYGGDKYE